MVSLRIRYRLRFLLSNKIRDSYILFYLTEGILLPVSGGKNKILGSIGEVVAERYLISKGYKILKKNWFCYAGELDLIAFKKKFVFIEVKTVSKKTNSDPTELLTRRKRLKWYHTSNYFLLRHKLLGADWRFDFVGIVKDGKRFLLRHYKNIELP